LVDVLNKDLNIGTFLHQSGEGGLLFLDLRLNLDRRDLNQGNPSIKIVMDLFLKTGSDLHFLLHAMCNRVQREVLGTVKKRFFDGFCPIFPDLKGVKPPYVGLGGSGQPLPRPSH
jgi:hypothetical protein